MRLNLGTFSLIQDVDHAWERPQNSAHQGENKRPLDCVRRVATLSDILPSE
jgi:hypothetical protein